MKLLILLTILLFILNGQGSAQKLGYKEFQVGKNINDSEFYKYEIRELKKDTSIKFIIPEIQMFFCDIPIESILLHIDSTNAIDKTSVRTNEIVFKNYKAFRDKFFELVDCMMSVFGKADDMSLNNKELQKVVIWELKDVRVLLRLSTDDMSSFAENEKRAFIISWTYKKKPKLW